MIRLIDEPFKLSLEMKDLILPITVKPGLLPAGTEHVLKYFPSLRTKIEELQAEALSVGSFIKTPSDSNFQNGIRFNYLVTDFRPRPGANINYMTQALGALSAHLRTDETNYFVAPLATVEEMPLSLISDLITGIMHDHPADVGFYLK